MVKELLKRFPFFKKKQITKPVESITIQANDSYEDNESKKELQEVANNLELQGYSSKQEQEIIYTSLLSCGINFENDSILDVGCGVGDLWGFLNKELKWDKSNYYLGIDYNPNMIDLAKEKYPTGIFQSMDILSLEKIQSDWTIACNIFNTFPTYNEEVEKNIELIVEKMYNIAQKGVILNFVYQDAVMPLINKFLRKYQKIIFRSDYMSEDYCIYIYK